VESVASKEVFMGGVVALLRERAEDAERQAERLREMVTLAEKLGDEGIAEFVAMVASDEPSNGHAANGNGHGNGVQETEKVPRGREAVRQIVRDRPGIWTLAELRAEMKQREWFASNKGLDVAVSRLCEVGEGKRIGRGRYVFPSNHGEEAAIESDPSDGAMIPFTT
jgi:hypothetical protein